jgi:hypothetical protein
MMVAVSLGFRAAMLAGAACYVLAALSAGFLAGADRPLAE